MFLTVGCKVKLQLAGRSGLGVGWGNSDNNPLSYFFVGSLRLHGFNWLSMVRTNIRDRVALYCSASLSNQLFLMNMQPFTYVSAFVSTSDGKHWGHWNFFPRYVWWVDYIYSTKSLSPLSCLLNRYYGFHFHKSHYFAFGIQLLSLICRSQ